MYRSVWMAVLILFMQAHANAQADCRLELKGQVVETHNFKALYPVVVFVDELNRSFETDEQGRFTVVGICEGNYTIHFQLFGYEPLTEVVTVTGNTERRFKMDHREQQLQQVVVTEERVPTVVQSKEQLNQAVINANSGKTIADMLQQVNGVSVLSNGATVAKPVIHGLHNNRIVMLNNGIRQEDQQWGDEHAPNIDPFLASNITVVKGAAGVKYGTDAIGGVVLVEPAPLRYKPGWDGEVNLAGFSNNRMGVGSAMIEHNFKQVPSLSFRLQGTFKKGGNYRIPGYWAANTGVEETNYSATLGWRRGHIGTEVFYSHFDTDLGIYRGSHTGNRKDLDAAINSPVPLVTAGFTYDIANPRQHVTHDLLKTKVYVDSRVGLWNLVYAYQHNFRQEYDVVRIDKGVAQLNLTLNTQTLSLNLQHHAIGPVKGEAGVDAIYQENFFQPGDRLFIPNYRAMGGAGYLIERYKCHNWVLEGGLRYDRKWFEMFNPEGSNQQVVRYTFNYSSVSGTLGFRQQLRPDWDWSATLSNAWRAPQASELFSSGLHQGAARVEYGDKGLQPERSFNLNLETKHVLHHKLTTDLSVYTQFIRDYIFLQPDSQLLTIRGYYKTFRYHQTDAWLSGIDLSLAYQWNDYLQTDAKASILRARDLKKNDWLILMPSDRVSLGTKYTRTINDRFKDCFLGIDGKYVLQQTRIPANFDEIDNPRPPAAYFLLDAEIGTTFAVRNQPVDFSFTVSNILNTSYRDYLDAFRYFIDQQGRNMVIRVRVPFNINSKKDNNEKL